MNPGRESYAKGLANLSSVLAGLAAIAAALLTGGPRTRPPKPGPGPVAAASPRPASKPLPPARAPEKPRPAAPLAVVPAPAPEPAPEVDRAALAEPEADLDAASRDRARAEGRADNAAKRLAAASLQAAADARASKVLAFRVRDPSARIASASSRGGFLKADRDRLKTEAAALATAARPKAKILSNKNPVARPADGDEQHFELRHDRVSYVDIDRLIALVQSDARLRIRLSDAARVVSSRVGPVGAFSMHYSLSRGLPSGLDELMQGRVATYNLRGWEVIPEFEGRGERYEATTRPASEFARVINRLTPSKATVTLWVYPDSFTLFRRLRDDLQARGFLVAARPLPEGMAIRGSPGGSLSAGQ